MGSGITLDDAAIVSTVLEGILYGFSLLMFIGIMWVLVQEEGYNASNRAKFVIAITFLVLSTAHMVVNVVRMDEGLVKYRYTFPGGPSIFFDEVGQNTFIIKFTLYTLQTLLGDGVVIYRCYVVWQSIWVVIFPAMLWCTAAATGVTVVYGVSRDADTILHVFVGPEVTAFYACTLSTNLLSSGLLAYRMWTIDRNVGSFRISESTIMPVLRALIDSAALYSATLLALIICFVMSNNWQFVILDLLVPIISISFYMVIVRVAIQRKRWNCPSNTRDTGRPATVGSRYRPFGMRLLPVHMPQHSRNASISPDPLTDSQGFKIRSDGAAYLL